MWDLLSRGGWVMYVILGCSVISLTVIIERAVYFLRTKDSLTVCLCFIKKYLDAGSIEKLRDYASKKRTHLNATLDVYFMNFKKSKNDLEEELHKTGNYEIKKMETRLSLLSSVSVLTPLLGLLGTVLGMITSFQKIHTLGASADVSTLAGGIWQSLLTTAFGLIVAITVAAINHFYDAVVTNRSDDMQFLIQELHSYFFHDKDQSKEARKLSIGSQE